VAWGLAHSLWEHERRWEEEKPGWGAMAMNRGAVPELMLKYELEADLIGFELAARAGFPPQAGLSMWEKLRKAQGGMTRTHWEGPMGDARLSEAKRNMPAMIRIFDARPR
jgi:predicted Zn-dependent protease